MYKHSGSRRKTAQRTRRSRITVECVKMDSTASNKTGGYLQQALVGAGAFAKLVESYKSYLYEQIRPFPVFHVEDEDLQKRHYEIISEINAICPFLLIWEHSEFSPANNGEPDFEVRDESSDRIVTRQMIGKTLQAADRADLSFNSPQMYVQRARRLVDAGITFGLVAPHEIEMRSNRKPLKGTPKLHDLVVSVFSEFVSALSGDKQPGRTIEDILVGERK